MLKHTRVWTDGACLGNGNDDAHGGMGVYSPDAGIKMSVPWTAKEVPTNQKCELLAAIIALQEIEGDVVLYTDSEYIVKGMMEWIPRWIARDWKKSRRGSPVKNVDYWKRLLVLTGNRDVIFRHVKAHSGVKGNEKADRLANAGAIMHEMNHITPLCSL
jgi:ribonuclease HI